MIITAGEYKGCKMLAPDEKITRPTLSKVRMGVFNSLQSIMDFNGKSFLDLYAGSGIMGLEALSRGFSYVCSVEKNSKVAEIIKTNFSKFKNAPKLIIADSLKLKLSEKFDVVYIDPPYFSGIYEQSVLKAKEYCKNIIVVEHLVNINFQGCELLKQKKYGDKLVSFLKVNL